MIQFRLYAFYNQKEKAIGLATQDLSHFLSASVKSTSVLPFEKCFDKSSTLTFEVKVKDFKPSLSGSLTHRPASSSQSMLVPIVEEDNITSSSYEYMQT